MALSQKLVDEWDYKKNGDSNPYDIPSHYRKKVWWICEKAHSWMSTPHCRSNGSGCPICAGRKVLRGFNDLASRNPKLAAEWDLMKNDIEPYEVTEHSGRKVWWVCSNNHSWIAKVSNRSNGNGCPYCSGRYAIQGKTDLVSLNPGLASEWDYEKNMGIQPADVTLYSKKKIWWKCQVGHSWQEAITNRSREGCPYCSGRRVIAGENDLKTLYPHLVTEWDYEKNEGYHPEMMCAKSVKKVWWKCGNGHSWEAAIFGRVNGNGCPYCSGRVAISGENDLVTLNPSLAFEWDFQKNGELVPSLLKEHSNKKVWWLCKNNHSWKASVNNRSKGTGCPYCSGRYAIQGETDLESQNPDLAAEWDYIKNKPLCPFEVTEHSNRIVWWKCKNNHSWRAMINKRSGGNSCPYCAGQRAISGVNDLATMRPMLLTQWDYSLNTEIEPDNIAYSSGRKVWWRCCCGHGWEASVGHRSSGNGCPLCSGRYAIEGENDMATIRPDLIEEWDSEKNLGLNSKALKMGSHTMVWWKCRQGHSWRASVYARAGGSGCPKCWQKRRRK